MKLQIKNILIFSFVLRFVVIVLTYFADSFWGIRYTDVDYFVFSDASGFVLDGKSPYERYTYRYTPLLSYFLVFNHLIHQSFGKVFFSLLDVLMGYLSILLNDEKNLSYTIFGILFNPILINVSTRGNADQTVVLFVLLTLYFLKKDRISLAGLMHGLSVHMKMYPVIYYPTIFFHLSGQWKKRFQFFFCSFFVNVVFVCLFYWLYGYPFLYESYLYHFIRSDNRHNFSVYFYSIYLNSISKNSLLSLSMFLPQMILLVLIGYRYRAVCSFAFLIQTWIFVHFNKVFTVQYFIWYISLLPIALPSMLTKKKKEKEKKKKKTVVLSIILSICWGLSQLIWLGFAYQLEFLGLNSFLKIWCAGILFFIVNVAIVITMIYFFNTTNNQKNNQEKGEKKQ